MESWFLPPSVTRAPPFERIPEVKSAAYRGIFLTYWRGTEVDIDGILYQGGRWHGPLTDDEVTAITNAGLVERIVQVNDYGELPGNLDP